jgi:aspartyl-tRNA(Asn)/glutamyl-tRNA(Gln) amidotransferase subunit C
MTIKKEDVERIAHLARIQVDDTVLAKTTSSLGEVLALVDQLQAADTSGITPLAHPLDMAQRLRPDEVTETDRREALMEAAPEQEEGLFLVPRVID